MWMLGHILITSRRNRSLRLGYPRYLIRRQEIIHTIPEKETNDTSVKKILVEVRDPLFKRNRGPYIYSKYALEPKLNNTYQKKVHHKTEIATSCKSFPVCFHIEILGLGPTFCCVCDYSAHKIGLNVHNIQA